MQYRILGKNGPRLPAMGFGCMGLTGSYNPVKPDARQMLAVLDRAIEQGLTFLDTADVLWPGGQ